jgi:hypothetical protein
MSCDESKLIFTRYLYSLDDVKHSLFIAILNKNSDEALFWLFEIYYSGFVGDAFRLVMNIYTEVFSFDNPDLAKPFHRIMKTYEDSQLDMDVDDNGVASIDTNASATANASASASALGTIVHNLCLRNYRIDLFVKTYIGVVCEPSVEPDLSKKHLYITLKPDNIQKYETKPPIEPPYLYLREVCKYSAHKETNAIFGEVQDGVFKDLYLNHWLYFAYKSPIWKERVDAYGGRPVDDQKKIAFYNEAGEEDDDLESEFYSVWNMETDEQPPEVVIKSTGHDSMEYITIADFCRRYGGVMKTKKLGRKLKVDDLSASFNNMAIA